MIMRSKASKKSLLEMIDELDNRLIVGDARLRSLDRDIKKLRRLICDTRPVSHRPSSEDSTSH